MKAQKSSEDDESGVEAVEMVVCFGNESVSKSGGSCGCPNRQSTNDLKHGYSICYKRKTLPRHHAVCVSWKCLNSNESRLYSAKTNSTDRAWLYQATAVEQ